MKFAVTNGRNWEEKLVFLARQWATDLRVPYLPRSPHAPKSLDSLLQEHSLECLLVVTQQGLELYSEAGRLSYHPSMAVLRLQTILAGGEDHFATACSLKPGSKLLDATLGLASDAAIASFVVGKTGRVVGLEASQPLWFLVKEGLAHYQDKNPFLTESLRRITALNKEAYAYLRSLPADVFDVVYFDPMFKFPVAESSNMQPLRPVSYQQPLTRELLQEALRVAPRVVVKERFYAYFKKLGIEEITGGKYSRVHYGILRR